MHRTGLFLTDAPIVENGHGGGVVAFHELAAMRRKLGDVDIVEQKDLQVEGLPFHPFINDYVAWNKTRGHSYENIFINGTPFGLTAWSRKMEYVDAPGVCRVIVDVPAHSLADSIDEHHRLGVPYERMYPHMVQPDLWKWMNIDRTQVATDIVCPSQYSVNELRKILDFGREEPEFHVIPHGCDLPIHVKPFVETDKMRFGYAGSAGPDKGVLYLLHAWNVFSFADAEMIIAGQHSEDIRKWALDMNSGKGAQYRFLGFQKTLDNFYDGIHVFVCPSVTEGFNLEVLEAMSHGRPVICSDGAGAHELVKDGHDGLIFPKRDMKKLAECIAFFKDNPGEVKKMGQNARQTAEQYSWPIIESRYEKELFS